MINNIINHYNKMEPLVPNFLVIPLTILELILTIVSIPLEITVVGSIIADAVAGVISLLLGDLIGMFLSILALIPFIGSFFGVAKIFKTLFKLIKLFF
jgi:hypothetical protein